MAKSEVGKALAKHRRDKRLRKAGIHASNHVLKTQAQKKPADKRLVPVKCTGCDCPIAYETCLYLCDTPKGEEGSWFFCSQQCLKETLLVGQLKTVTPELRLSAFVKQKTETE